MKKFKKKIIGLFILASIYFLVSNFLFSTKNLFGHVVISPIPNSVSNIKSYKDWSVMHGPVVFTFTADKNDMEEIIKINSLSKYEEIPDIISDEINRIEKKVNWWKSSSELEKMRIYGKITENKYDWNALFIFIDANNTNYIISS